MKNEDKCDHQCSFPNERWISVLMGSLLVLALVGLALDCKKDAQLEAMRIEIDSLKKINNLQRVHPIIYNGATINLRSSTGNYLSMKNVHRSIIISTQKVSDSSSIFTVVQLPEGRYALRSQHVGYHLSCSEQNGRATASVGVGPWEEWIIEPIGSGNTFLVQSRFGMYLNQDGVIQQTHKSPHLYWTISAAS